MNYNVNFKDGSLNKAVNFGQIQQVKGDDGASAYEIAVKNGFEGSETEWLASLHGKDGQNGHTPIKGTDYWTPEDIAEIKGYVDDAINTAMGDVESVLDGIIALESRYIEGSTV